MMNLNKKIIKSIEYILPIILTIFIWHNLNASGNNIIFLLIMICLHFVTKKVIAKTNKEKAINIFVISTLFSIASLIGKSVSQDYTLNHVFDKWLIINFIGYFCTAFIIISLLYELFEKLKLDDIEYKYIKNYKFKLLIIFVLIVLAWIPYLLRYYPGIITPDSNWQLQQALGMDKLSNHHSVLQTGVISIAVNLGLVIFNSIEAGICIYSVISIIIMALIDTYVLYYLEKRNVHFFVRVIVLMYYMFYPVNAYYSIIMWKDIFFSGTFSLLFILFIELTTNTENFLSKKKNIAFFIIISLLTIYLRNNGLYCIAIAMPFTIITLKKYWKKILPMFCSILLIYFVTNAIMYNIFNVIKVASGEALSIPVQQIARVDKYYRDELDDATKKEIYSYFTYENIGDYYNPILSDDVKFKFKSEYFNEHKIEFLELWIKLFMRYPKTYFESFFSNSYGYYYIEAQNQIFSQFSDENELGIVQTPAIESKILDRFISASEYSTIPIYSMLYSIAFMFWTMIACIGYNLYKKRKKIIIAFIPLLVLWLTIIASPVFCEFRYAYPLFTCAPIFISLNLVKERKEENGEGSGLNTML